MSSSVGSAWFWERVVSGVLVYKKETEYPFVPVLCMFTIEKGKGRSGGVCTFDLSGITLACSLCPRYM